MNNNVQEIGQANHLMFYYSQANDRNVMASRVAIENGDTVMARRKELWSEPKLISSDDESLGNQPSLLGTDMLSNVARTISKTVQFPANTIFAHGLGIVASAMSKSFYFEYGTGVKPVNLYVVTAQPPSSGKSGVNELLGEPVHHAFDEINRSTLVEQRKLKALIATEKANMKKAETKEQQFAASDEIERLFSALEKHVVYTYALDDATPEAVANIALKQNGIFNIISAEADAINVVLGGVYSDKKANYGVFLKGWDHERHIQARSNKDTISGKVAGNIAVIAQDESIKTILEAGEQGRGISERFLLVREPTLLGTRNFGKPSKLDEVLMANYGKTIFNLVREQKTTLKFSPSAKKAINDYRAKVEPEMGDHGVYSNNMMRGFIGKADKQIMKVASILHCIENWQPDGEKSTTIKDSTVKQAMGIFMSIVNTYTSAADELGFTGAESEYKKVEEKLSSYAEKGKNSISINQLRGALKGVKPFTGTPQLTTKLKEIILPTLEECNVCIVNKDKIYINPHLKG